MFLILLTGLSETKMELMVTFACISSIEGKKETKKSKDCSEFLHGNSAALPTPVTTR